MFGFGGNYRHNLGSSFGQHTGGYGCVECSIQPSLFSGSGTCCECIQQEILEGCVLLQGSALCDSPCCEYFQGDGGYGYGYGGNYGGRGNGFPFGGAYNTTYLGGRNLFGYGRERTGMSVLGGLRGNIGGIRGLGALGGLGSSGGLGGIGRLGGIGGSGGFGPLGGMGRIIGCRQPRHGSNRGRLSW